MNLKGEESQVTSRDSYINSIVLNDIRTTSTYLI